MCYDEVNLAWKIISHQLMTNEHKSNKFDIHGSVHLGNKFYSDSN
jgi:hypothetical protein